LDCTRRQFYAAGRLDLSSRPQPSAAAPMAGWQDTADSRLIAKIAAGDLSGLGILFARYEGMLRRFMGRFGVRAAEIDDLVQLTFLDVVHAAAAFDGRPSIRNWLMGLAAIRVRRHRRTMARMAEVLWSWAQEPVCAAPTPAERLELAEAAARAKRALARVSAKKRQVFAMVVFQGSSSEEVARALGIPVGTVWTRLHHARRQVRQHLAKEGT
jgi:RNA polymerase sigma factor (sigma-70 family)